MKTSPEYVVYLASFTWPPEDVGGPGAVLRLLSQAIHEKRGRLDIGGSTIPVKALFGDLLFDLRLTDPTKSSRPRIAVSGTSRLVLGRIVNWVNNRPLCRLALSLWSRVITRRIVELIGADSSGRIPIVVSFGPPLIYRLSKHKKKLNAIFIHTEHSKGGAAREAITHRDEPIAARELRALTKIDKHTIERSERLVFPSIGAKKLYQESYADETKRIDAKSFIWYNAVEDLADAHRVPDGEAAPRIVLNVASHVPEKNVELALRGFHQFLSDDPRRMGTYRFVNVGPESGLTQGLKILAQDLGLSNSVEFLGCMRRDDLLSLMRTAWVFVSTPSKAVFDLSLLEAMSMGKPVVASRVGGNVEALGVDYRHLVLTQSDVALELATLGEADGAASQAGRWNRERFLAHFTLDQQIKNLAGLVYGVARGCK